MYYGLTECAFAVITGWRAIGVLSGSLPADWLALLAAAYLFVRGLVNYEEGKSEKEERRKIASPRP
jgi:hypothetical protein